MTDLPAPPPPRDPDDVASDVVDGLLPPDEAAAAQRDPAVTQRVRRILEARDALRSTPPVDADAAERAIAAAVDALDPMGTPAGTADQDRATSPLSPSLRSIDSTGMGSETSEDTAASGAQAESSEPDQAGEESTAEGGGAGAAPDAGDGASSATEGQSRTRSDAPVPQLGAVRDADELAARVTPSVDDSLDRSPQQPDAGAPAADESAESLGETASCDGLTATGDPSRGVSVFVADAVLDGTPVRVHVYRSGGQPQLVATDDACTTVVDVPLDQ
jgi:hypothetical protein